MLRAAVQQQPSGSGKFLICQPQLQSHRVPGQKRKLSTKIRVGRKHSAAKGKRPPLQFLHAQVSKNFGKLLFHRSVKTAAPYEPVLLFGKGDLPPRQRRAVCQIEIVEHHHGQPLRRDPGNLVIRIRHRDRSSQTRQPKSGSVKLHTGISGQFLRVLSRQPVSGRFHHFFEHPVFRHTRISFPCPLIRYCQITGSAVR